jgi:homoserine dehydrogenase
MAANSVVRVALVGPGQVGAELLRQLAAHGARAAARRRTAMHQVAVASSSRMLLWPDPEAPAALTAAAATADWGDRLRREGVPAGTPALPYRHVYMHMRLHQPTLLALRQLVT